MVSGGRTGESPRFGFLFWRRSGEIAGRISKYLRDNMGISAAGRVQRGHAFAIVGEADSLLIDEAHPTQHQILAKGGDGGSVQSLVATRVITGVQRHVEAIHFGMRKTLLEYDDAMNAQRKAVYAERQAILDGKDLAAAVPEVIEDAAKAVVAKNCPNHGAWNVQAVEKWASEMTGQRTFKVSNVRHGNDPARLANALTKYLKALYTNKESQLGAPIMQAVATQVMMRSIDARWMSHLREMDTLKTSISLRAIGHRDPKLKYKEEAHKAFAALTQSMYEDYLQALLRGQLTVKLKAGNDANVLA